MHEAIARHQARQARAIPILLRPTDWQDAPFAKLQVLPSHAKPVSQWRRHDDAFADVIKGIRRAIEDLNASASPTRPIASPSITTGSTSPVGEKPRPPGPPAARPCEPRLAPSIRPFGLFDKLQGRA